MPRRHSEISNQGKLNLEVIIGQLQLLQILLNERRVGEDDGVVGHLARTRGTTVQLAAIA